jgi:hypothetical protein
MLFCYAWLKLLPKKYYHYDMFNNLVVLSLCGDDSIGTIADEVKEWFNMTAISAVWAELGIQVKVEAANEGTLVTRNFLSQSTRLYNGMYVPVPDYDKSVSTTLWHTKSHLHIRWSYLKACALRLSTFWCLESRMLFADYIRYLKTNHYAELHSPCSGTLDDPFTFEQVNTVYRDDQMIAALYARPESQSAVNNESDLKGSIPPKVYECVLQIINATQEVEEQEANRESEGRIEGQESDATSSEASGESKQSSYEGSKGELGFQSDGSSC